MAANYAIKRIDDRAIFDFFMTATENAEKALALARQNGTLKDIDHNLSVRFSSLLPWEFSEYEISEGGRDAYCIGSAQLTFSARRNQNESNSSVTFSISRNSDLLNDKFSLSNSNNGAFQGEGERSVLREIHQCLSPLLRPVAPEDGGLIPTLSNLAESFSSTYRDISKELSVAVAAVNSERTRQLNEFQEERTRLRNEIATERATFQEQSRSETEARRAEAEKEREALKAEIEVERKTLKAEWAKLEVSSHKDARRRQFTALQEELGKALTAPVADGGLRTTRWAVFAAMILAGGVAGYFAFGSIAAGTALSAPGTTTEAWVFPAIRSVVLTVTSLASFFGAAAWLRYFYVRDLQAHEELRRFQNDMARASWVMEAALEIRKEHNEDIPPEWIAGVTEGLFAARKKDTLEEGAQALAALLGISASASFGPGGVSVELGKKAGKALAKAGTESQS